MISDSRRSLITLTIPRGLLSYTANILCFLFYVSDEKNICPPSRVYQNERFKPFSSCVCVRSLRLYYHRPPPHPPTPFTRSLCSFVVDRREGVRQTLPSHLYSLGLVIQVKLKGVHLNFGQSNNKIISNMFFRVRNVHRMSHSSTCLDLSPNF